MVRIVLMEMRRSMKKINKRIRVKKEGKEFVTVEKGEQLTVEKLIKLMNNKYIKDKGL